jgi:hypothetical protein
MTPHCQQHAGATEGTMPNTKKPSTTQSKTRKEGNRGRNALDGLELPPEFQQLLENINRQVRKVTKNRGVVPNIDSALRLLTLVLRTIDRRAKERARPDWPAILLEDRRGDHRRCSLSWRARRVSR